ncbi:phage tail family protein [Cytobacillus sp. FSL H8-0458]|uniref:phage tail family protein n=1 Tax=Cytobacillus sp. FSL H8-0458 TaxID=2975346 RepID=UPI0030F57AEA
MSAKLVFTNGRGISIELSSAPPFIVSKIEGLGGVEGNIETQKAPFQDGSSYIDTTLSERPLAFVISIIGDNIPAHRSFVSSIFNPKTGIGTLSYIDGEVKKEIKAIPERVPVFPSGKENRGFNYQVCTVDLLALDPFWLDPYESSEPLSAWIGKFKFPFKFPVEFGEKANRTTINNDGDVETPVFIDFYGPAINPTVTNETTGQRIRIKRTLSATDKLEVSTEFGNKYVEIVAADGSRTNAFHWIDLSADPILFQLALGENDISFSSDDPASTGSVNIRYKKRYVAV